MEEEAQIKKVLEGFNSSFKILQDMTQLSSSRIQQLLEKLTAEINKEVFSIDIELPRNWNIIAFLYFLLEDYDNARTFAHKAEDQQPNNINSKVILAHCHLRKAEFYDVGQICDELLKLRGNDMEMLLAKAEMAYTYARFGMQMFEKAETIYRDVCSQCDSVQDVPACHVALWKFGLALTMKRSLNIHNLYDYNKDLYQEEKIKTIIEIFLDVTRVDDRRASKCAARANVEIGLLMNAVENNPNYNVDSFPAVFEKHTEDYFDEALRLCPNDNFVLERSGKYFRYKGKIELSILLLEKAVAQGGTSFSHHHLALSLKKQLEKSPVPRYGGRRGRHSTQAGRRHHPQQHQHQRQPRGSRTATGDSICIRMIKSPRTITRLEESDTTEQIMHHLDIAYDLADNIGALYDKGLTLRALAKTEEALDVFKSIIAHKKTSLLQLANSYEQAAFCLLAQGAETGIQQRKEKHEYDIIIYLKKSIEVAFTMVANIPSLSDCWESVPTLKSLLEGTAKTKDKLKQLAFLNAKLHCYKEAIDCLKEIDAMEEGETKDVELNLNLVRTYMMSNDYEQAVLHLDMNKCLPEAILKVDSKLYLSTYIEGGMQAVKVGEFRIAGMRFRKALDYGNAFAKMAEKREQPHDTKPTPGDDDDNDDDDSFDIYIYSSQTSEEKWKILKDTLLHIGVRTIHNSDNLKPGTMEFRGMIGNIQLSTHFIIALESEDAGSDGINQMFVDQIIRARTEKNASNIVTVRETEEVQIPPELRIFQSVVVRPNTQYAESPELSPETLDSIKDLLYKLATPMP